MRSAKRGLFDLRFFNAAHAVIKLLLAARLFCRLAGCSPLVQGELEDYQPKERCKRVGFEADSRVGDL